MIKFNRTTEYALVALRHMSHCDSTDVTSAREIADAFGFPFEITAKTLQRLRDGGLIQSAQGARGGYTLQRSLEDVTLAEFLQIMEGPQAVVACGSSEESSKPASSKSGACEYSSLCEIRGVMVGLNDRVIEFLSSIKLAELTGERERTRRIPVQLQKSFVQG